MSSRSLPRKKTSSEPEAASRRVGDGVRRFLAAWGPVLAFEALVFFLSSRPYLQVPGNVPNLDKGAHFLEYAALGGLLFRAFRLWGTGRGRALVFALALAAGLGAADERFQRLIPGRVCSILDWTADLCGAFAGAFLARALEARLPARLWTLRHASAPREQKGSR
jgi:VanZ family protein